jgi:hypothetical protein
MSATTAASIGIARSFPPQSIDASLACAGETSSFEEAVAAEENRLTREDVIASEG